MYYHQMPAILKCPFGLRVWGFFFQNTQGHSDIVAILSLAQFIYEEQINWTTRTALNFIIY